MSGRALTDDVATTERTHHCGMRHASGNVATVSGAVEMLLAIYGEGHLAAENDMGGSGSVCVVGVFRIWSIGPDISVGKTFSLQLRCESSFVQHLVQTFRLECPEQNSYALLLPSTGGEGKEGALSSSGEKIVYKPGAGGASAEGGAIGGCFIPRMPLCKAPSFTVKSGGTVKRLAAGSVRWMFVRE